MSFKCKICGHDADIWYEYGQEFSSHLDYEPEDDHDSVPPDYDGDED